MDTNLSISQIHLALRNSGIWNKRSDIMIPYHGDYLIMKLILLCYLKVAILQKWK